MDYLTNLKARGLLKRTVSKVGKVAALICLLLVTNSSFAQTLNSLSTENPPLIDGVLDDEIWNQAPMVSGFKTFVPDFSKDMEEKTEVFMAHDQDNLYFAFKCYDDPTKIKTSISARDRISADDWVCVNLDSFNDQQTLYGFYVNPSGIQMDSRYASGRDDPGIDMVWYSAGNITDEGYEVEIQIPFKSIRYKNGDPVEMGVIFERRISRLSTQGTFPALDPNMGYNFLIQSDPIHYRNVRKFTLFELLPAVTYSNRKVAEEGSMIQDINRADFSLTAKYGITSDLILDATYNPDFSQVESDAGQIDENQRFALFFPERRPFFLEGNEIFNFGGVGHRDPIRSVVNTRSIVNPRAATKLTGRIGKKNTIGAIFALDEIPPDEVNGGDTHAKAGVLRYKRAFNDDSYIGAAYTTRSINDSYNQVLGADALIRLTQASNIESHFLTSFTKDSANADIRQDHAFVAEYAYRNRKLSTSFSVTDLSEDFQSDIGFVTRTGVTQLKTHFSPKIYPEKKVLKRIDPMLYISYTYDKPSELFEHSYFLNSRFTLIRNSNISASYNWKTEIYRNEIFDRNSFRISAGSQITKRIQFNLSYSNGKKIRYQEDPYQGYGTDASAGLDLQFSDNFNSQLSYRYSDFFRESNDEKIFDYGIVRSRNTYQFNQYLFFRIILEHNSFRDQLSTDFLASFTYIPGTVVHLGYGSLYDKMKWDDTDYVEDDRFHETVRGFFFKASYLFRK
jgi:hypothetical protein